MAKVIRI